MKWKTEDLDRLRDMYESSYTNAEIADWFGCSVQRIKDGLRNYGISCRSNASRRKAITQKRIVVPQQYREPAKVPEVVTATPEPRNRALDFMDAIEHNLCCWLDGKLKACGHERFKGNRYCHHHWEKSLKRNEV